MQFQDLGGLRVRDCEAREIAAFHRFLTRSPLRPLGTKEEVTKQVISPAHDILEKSPQSNAPS
ncbi:hypothetical protein PILCRDRAFT_8659 [Piloderma croceum F 1598]|uniref:Uncharacterized protein n=1 Tax=Piloderma croceum (strain F 1598) TaxID=765440 RepID=A0A0C3FAJ5_PILCF|nr:hypothetical protein PILCRDRAFT_8659 [Piloderma croceum F 1598]